MRSRGYQLPTIALKVNYKLCFHRRTDSKRQGCSAW